MLDFPCVLFMSDFRRAATYLAMFLNSYNFVFGLLALCMQRGGSLCVRDGCILVIELQFGRFWCFHFLVYGSDDVAIGTQYMCTRKRQIALFNGFFSASAGVMVPRDDDELAWD